MKPNNFFTYLNCTVSFRSDGINDDLAYYLKLSNVTASTDLSGVIFNDVYPYIENAKPSFYLKNHSITFQEQFDISSWTDGDEYIPMLFVKTNNGLGDISNYYFSMVYEPLIPT